MRKSLRFSQHKLGRLLGLAEQSIARMEKGETRINHAAQILLRAMVIQQARIPLNLMSWVARFGGNQTGDGK